MLHLRPVLLEVEVGAVVQVVALHAHLHDVALVEDLALLVAFVVDDLEPQLRAKLFELFFAGVDLAGFGGDVLGGRAVAVLAAVADQVRRFLQANETGLERKILLRLPARRVAAEALGIEVPRRIDLATIVSVAWKCGVFSKTSVADKWQSAHTLLPANLRPDRARRASAPNPRGPAFPTAADSRRASRGFPAHRRSGIERHALVAKRVAPFL